MSSTESLYAGMVADGDDPDAPRRVRVAHRGDRAVVTLDEPDRLNALSAPLVRQLRCAIEALVADSGIRSVVLTGADPGFSAGGDLTMMRSATEQLTNPEGVADVWRWIRREFGGIARIISGSVSLGDTAGPIFLTPAACGDRVRRMLGGGQARDAAGPASVSVITAAGATALSPPRRPLLTYIRSQAMAPESPTVGSRLRCPKD